MANLTHIARPYAQAAFEYARHDKQRLTAWKTFLDTMSMVATQPSVRSLLNNPAIPEQQLFDLFYAISNQITSDAEYKNFLLLLAQNHRFILFPDIATLFNTYFAAFEKMSSVEEITAIKIDEHYQQQLIDAISKRIQRRVTLRCEIDPHILGGAVIRIGDHVIDSSIRGQLTRLLEFSLR